MSCPLFLVSHSFLSHESSLSSSVSLICSVVVAIISLTLVLLNLIPLSLFSSVYNFSPLIPFFSLFVLLRVPLGSTGTLPRVVSPIFQHVVEMLSEPKGTWRTHSITLLLWESSATLAHHTCIPGMKSWTFCSRSSEPDWFWSTHTSELSFILFSHTLQI